MTVRALPRVGGRVLAAVVAAACALALLIGAPSTPAAAQPSSSEEAGRVVEETDQRLREARELADQLSRELDSVAARYEHAQAHHLRLEGEAEETLAAVTAAEQRAAAEEGAFARQVASAYMRPDTDALLAESVTFAPDASTALHRVALVGRITLRQRARADRAHHAVATTADATRQHQIVQAGAHGAAEDSRRLAEELTVALGNAQHRVSQTAQALEQAKATRDRLAEEERQRAEEQRRREEAARRAASIAARGSGPLPPVDGKVCPIGAPNAFIDSWGFPRSGGRQHQGVDMFAAYGMPLYAVADGTIRRVWNNRLGGLSIDLIDDRGDRYYYAHLSAAAVEGGERVRAGEVIGANGDSGNARGTPPHLHWQYHPGDGPAVNPYPLARALCR